MTSPNKSETNHEREPTFAVNASLPENQYYTIVDMDLQSTEVARPLGGGSAGLTYRAQYKGIDRAIKFLSPEPGGDKQSQVSQLTLKRLFTNEIAALLDLTHTNICKIVDFGTSKI